MIFILLLKKSHEIWSIKYGPGMKNVSNTVQHDRYFASKYLNWVFKKRHMKSSPSNHDTVYYGQYFASKYLKRNSKNSHMKSFPSNMVLVLRIYSVQSNRSNILLLNI